MTSEDLEVTSKKAHTLTRRELAGFDKVATDLAMEMQREGWLGYITSRGHAMMHHPDGSHQSLSRSSERASSGVAMRARFESWKRRRAERAEHPVFGELPEDPIDMPVSVRTLLEMKQHPAVGPYIVDGSNEQGDHWVVVGTDDRDQPSQWAVFDIRNAYPVLIGYGSQASEQGAWASLMLEHPDVFPEPKTETMTQGSETMAEMHVCPEPGCDKQFDSYHKTMVHNASAHHRQELDCPEPGCQWHGQAHVLKRHQQAAHEKTMHVCGMCGKEFTTSAGLGAHKGRTHRGQVDQPVTVTFLERFEPTVPEPVTDGDVPVTSPPATGDVLLDHLEHVPEGDDAEAMIAAVRSVVAGPLVKEIRRLREELVLMTKERDKFATEASDFEARLQLMREVMGV